MNRRRFLELDFGGKFTIDLFKLCGIFVEFRYLCVLINVSRNLDFYSCVKSLIRYMRMRLTNNSNKNHHEANEKANL